MKKVYKARPYRIVMNAVLGLFAGALAYFIAGFWLKPTTSIAIGVVFYLLFVWTVIIGNLITITVDDHFLTVKQGRKTSKFEIATSSFYAQTNTSGGETSCELTVTEANGKESYIDCELIGIKQFSYLLEDLGFTGEKAGVQKIETKKKN